jgi:uncharacterized protein (DUF2062 family)
MFGLSLAIVAISSRSLTESERVGRLRMVWTNLPSAAVAAGSAAGAAESPNDLVFSYVSGDSLRHAERKRGAKG